MKVSLMANKGNFAVDMIPQVVLAVLVIGFLAVVLGLGKNAADFIEKFIFGELTTGVPNTDLKAAIECSYLRCAQGCDATQGISVRFPTGTVYCKSHCESSVAAEGITDGKLCGEAAKKHPLMVRISDHNSYISTDDLAFTSACKDEDTCCIVPSERGTGTGVGIAMLIKDTMVKKVDIGEDRCHRFPLYARTILVVGLLDELVECSESATNNCGADTVTLNTGMYYVWSEQRIFGTANIVWDSYTEPIKSGNFVCCSNEWQDGIACTTGTLEDAKSCESSAADGTEACSKKCTDEGYPQSFYGTQRNEGDYMVCTCMDTSAGESEETTTTTPQPVPPGEENLD